jgi:DegV family protein with EDD domain
MTIKIVTDSTADLPSQLAKQLDITVVPVYVRFGDKTYRDRIDISEDEFYQRLQSDPIHPNTIQPSPQDFIDTYKELSQRSDGIVSIHVSGKLSGTFSSAMRAKDSLGEKYPIEVIDSQVVTMGLGQLAIEANNIVQSGRNLQQVTEAVKKAIPSIHLLGLLDTLKYLVLGGRIGKVKSLLSLILNIKPLLSMKNGELIPFGRVRSRSQGIEKLFNFVRNFKNIQDLAIVYNTTLDEADALALRIDPIYPKERIRLSRLGPALGVHTGPGILFVSIRGMA